MATPTLRSFSQIFGSMVATFRSLLGLPTAQVGDPSVTILEAAAQSDFRSTQEIMRALSWQNLNNRTGADLAATGAEEGVQRVTARPSTGSVTIGDSAFSKIATTVATGAVAGTTVILLADGGAFPASGSVYLGRDNGSEEGPIAFTRTGNILTLAAGTGNYHQVGDSVVLAQGGSRTIPSGTLVVTSPNTAGGQVQFSVQYDVQIADGEVSVDAEVECLTPGVVGNVGRGLISDFASKPFSTATVTNALAFSDGCATESEESYRESIRRAKKSRAKATETALVNAVLNATADDEGGRIASASLTSRFGQKALVIDDGNGYEDKDSGIDYEVLVGSAIGGEKVFALQKRPVAAAYVVSDVTTWVPVSGSVLTVMVGGVASSHQFLDADFYSTTSTTAEELEASINRDAALKFAARTAGTSLVLFAKSGTSEDLQVVEGGANEWLKFPTSRVYTINLYKNDRLLTKDGVVPYVESLDRGSWLSTADGVTLSITVDGIALSATINDADFVSANTGYATVSSLNSLAAWTAVLNNKLPGVTVSESAGRLRFESNKGASDSASIGVTGGTLSEAIFEVLPVTAQGAASEYTFDRAIGHIELATELSAGDSLTAGTASTRAFVEAKVASPTLASTAELWFAVDGNAALPATNIGTGSSVQFSIVASPAWGQRIGVEITDAWTNAAQGDWIVVTDSAVAAGLRGAFRIAQKISSSLIHIERPAATLGGTTTYTLAEGGIALVNCDTVPKKVSLSAGSYSASSLGAAIAAVVTGATSQVVGGLARIATNDPFGVIGVVAGNPLGLTLFDVGISNGETSHVGLSLSSNSDVDIPSFGETTTTVGGTTTLTTATNADAYVQAAFLRPSRDGANLNRESNVGAKASIVTGSTALTLTPAATSEWRIGDRLYFGRGFDMTARDTLSVVVDGDTVGGTYSIPMSRQTAVASYGGTWELEEVGGDSLAKTFGTSFDWRDFAALFHSRTKTHASPDTSKTILWRWWRVGPEGDSARIQYQYPLAASSNIAVETDVLDVVVRLQSGAARSVPTFRATSKIGMAAPTLAASLHTLQFVASLSVSGASRVLRINYTSRNSTAFAGTVTGSVSGATATVVSDSNAGGSPAASGYIVVTTPAAGTFLSNETITAGAASATSSSGKYGYTTLTLTLPGAITNHGIPVGETIYFTPGDANFLPGAKQVDAVAATTISYIDSVATAASAAAIGSVSVDSGGEVTANGTSVVTGDIFSGNATTGWDSWFLNPVKITLAGGGRSWTGQHFEGPPTTSTTLTWKSVTGAQFYPLVANTAAQLATAVQALSGISVSATAVGTSGSGSATGVISDATYETAELGGANPWWEFSDGFNWVRSHTTPAVVTDNFVFTLRNTIATPLTSNADIANEQVFLTPVTASSVARWLDSGVSGLGARGGTFSTEAGRVCVQTDNLGSDGSIGIGGGSANSTGTSVRGMATADISTIAANTDTADGLGGLQWVWVQNSIGHNKNVFTSLTNLTSLSAAGALVLNNAGPKAWTRVGALTDNAVVYVERQGDLVALRSLTTTSVLDGDYIRIQACTAPPSGTTQVDSHNVGIFPVVKVSGNTVWIENATAVEQIAGAKYDFIAHDSIVPGDSVVFGNETWGDNVGSRLAAALGTTEWEVTLDNSVPITAYSTPTMLGSNYTAFRVVGTPARLLKQIVGIAPTSAGLSVVLSPTALYGVVSEGLGTTLIAANKLGFEVGTKKGLDGYRYNTGLIAQASRIIVGDEHDRVTYPGVAAGGTSYIITGPLVRRIQVALVVQASSQTEDARKKIQAAVAAEINSTPAGSPVSISKLAAAALRVPGVSSAVVVSPDPNLKFISVQPYEKAFVNALDGNISITFERGE